MAPELKLYRSTKDTHWFAFGPKTGWVIFPAEVGGWQKRQCAIGTDPIDMREVPLKMAFNTGIPGAPESAGRASDLTLPEMPPVPRRNRRKRGIICLNCNLTGCVGRCRFQVAERTPLLKSA